MTEPNGVPQKATGRAKIWPKVLLAGSLSLNLLVIGVVGGAFLRTGSEARFAGPMVNRNVLRDLGYGAFMDALPREQRRALGRSLRDRTGSLATNREVLEQEFSGMIEALRADPFEPALLQGILDTQKGRLNRRVLEGRKLVLQQIRDMSPTQRQAFADRLEKSMHHALERSKR